MCCFFTSLRFFCGSSQGWFAVGKIHCRFIRDFGIKHWRGILLQSINTAITIITGKYFR